MEYGANRQMNHGLTGLPPRSAASTEPFSYLGQELESYSHAEKWKAYLHGKLRPYLKGDVLEVGAGIGSNAKFFSASEFTSWLCLEPDETLATRIPRADRRDVKIGTIQSLPLEARFDSILYIDVLEHIEDDTAEMQLATQLLKPGGHLIVLVPAHQWLYSPMDDAVGHFRRYSRKSLLATAPAAELQLQMAWYLDSVGIAASLANRLLLRHSKPSVEQIRFWDNYLIPVSMAIDKVLGHNIGKSALAIWQKQHSA